MTPPLPPSGTPDFTFLYQVITGMDQKLDRLIETFVTVREFSKLEARVDKLESRWRANMAWILGLLTLLSSVAYSIVYFATR